MQAGQILALWAIPLMTIGHLVLALGITVYVFIGIHFEERDLVRNFGQRYVEYRNEVPKLIPVFKTAKVQKNKVEVLTEEAD
jgi:protein-S-isoprenylcysteine O-methyltransferase Ste14